MSILNELSRSRLVRSRQQQARSPEQAMILTRDRYDKTQAIATTPNGGEVQVTPLGNGGAMPSEFVAVRSGVTVYGIW